MYFDMFREDLNDDFFQASKSNRVYFSLLKLCFANKKLFRSFCEQILAVG